MDVLQRLWLKINAFLWELNFLLRRWFLSKNLRFCYRKYFIWRIQIFSETQTLARRVCKICPWPDLCRRRNVKNVSDIPRRALHVCENLSALRIFPRREKPRLEILEGFFRKSVENMMFSDVEILPFFFEPDFSPSSRQEKEKLSIWQSLGPGLVSFSDIFFLRGQGNYFNLHLCFIASGRNRSDADRRDKILYGPIKQKK